MSRACSPTAREPAQIKRREPHYQLSHDFLVPPLRQWLTQKERETIRGRARLCLGERTALWTSKREAKQLPSWREWLRILVFSERKSWTSQERRMMRAASSYHLMRSAAALGLCVLVAACALLVNRRLHERATTNRFEQLAQQRLAISSGASRSHGTRRPGLARAGRARSSRTHRRARKSAPERPSRWRGMVLDHLDLLEERLLDAGAPERLLLREELARWAGRLAPRCGK